MPAEDEILYTNKPYLLTLKGRITVHFLDSQTVEGELIAQDAFNVFLTIDQAPLMIPRSQIRYIKGQPGQVIAADTALAPTAKAPAQPAPPPGPAPAAIIPFSVPEPEPIAQFVDEEELQPVEPDLGGTMVVPARVETAAVPTPATASTPPARSKVEDTGQTLIINVETEALLPGPADTIGGPGLPPINFDELAHTLFEETVVVQPGEADDDVTFVLEKGEVEVSAHLVCTTGPHAGEVFQLKRGINTIGRSSDNTFPLSKDKEVSRRHSIITYEASKFVVQDQNSLNGTYVNNDLIKEPYPLEDGDILLIGISTLKFQER